MAIPRFDSASPEETAAIGKQIARLRGDDDFSCLGGEELLYGNGVSVIEWSERLSDSLPEDAIIVEIAITGGNTRRIMVRDSP